MLAMKLAKPEKMAWQYDYSIDWDAPVAAVPSQASRPAAVTGGQLVRPQRAYTPGDRSAELPKWRGRDPCRAYSATVAIDGHVALRHDGGNGSPNF